MSEFQRAREVFQALQPAERKRIVVDYLKAMPETEGRSALRTLLTVMAVRMGWRLETAPVAAEGEFVVVGHRHDPVPVDPSHPGKHLTANELVAALGEKAWDVCECGDWRWEHVSGEGRCRTCAASGPAPYNRCQHFRFSHNGKPDEVAEAQRSMRVSQGV
ncbi:MAG: hypothetical protein ACYCT1_08280 [Steroidobacteraceae bacterium]